MKFHVSPNGDLFDVSFYTEGRVHHDCLIPELDIDTRVFDRADSAIVTQILVPYEEWEALGFPENLARNIQCH